MKHYGIEQWVDFARDLEPTGNRKDMQDHLDQGCPVCRELVGFCVQLAAVCRGLKAFEVPEASARSARAIFPSPAPRRAPRVARLPWEIVFDSFLAPAPAGLRATWQIGWQGLYRAGDCSVDLRIEPDLGSSRASVIGQISNHVSPEIEMSDLPVYLRQGKTVLAEARSNRFGEFQMEYEQQRKMQLCIYLQGGSQCIQVPIKRLAADKRSATHRVNLRAPSGPSSSGEAGSR